LAFEAAEFLLIALKSALLQQRGMQLRPAARHACIAAPGSHSCILIWHELYKKKSLLMTLRNKL